MKKFILVLLICIMFLTGCTKSGYHYWEIGENYPEFIPANGTGTIYLDSKNYNLYRYYGEKWNLIGNIKGAPGETGGFSNVYINEQGFFVIDGIVTSTKANGTDGKTGNPGINGKNGKNGKNGIAGVAPTISVTDDGYLSINDIKSTMKVENSNKPCELIKDLDENLRISTGDEIKCATESFYVIDVKNENISMLAKYNLDVGYTYDEEKDEIKLIESPTGLQKEYAKAWTAGTFSYGIVPFTEIPYWDNGIIKGNYGTEYPSDVYDSNSFMFNYIQNYKKELQKQGLNPTATRLITNNELLYLGCTTNSCENSKYEWINNTSYWTSTATSYQNIFAVNIENEKNKMIYDEIFYGVRPVIEIQRKEVNDNLFIELEYEAKYCTYNGDLTPGVEFKKGPYTYTYKYDYIIDENYDLSFVETKEDGWHVALTDIDSSDEIQSVVCTTINGKPIVSSAFMFAGSNASLIDLKYFDTSKVKNMMSMFEEFNGDIINLNTLNTNEVIDMSNIFAFTNTQYLDLSKINTSNVTNMSGMFASSQIKKLNLINFDTSKVTGMSGMFSDSRATNIDLSSFDTSNVNDMSFMFAGSQVASLDLSSFDTSNVTDMSNMFVDSQVTSLDLSSFDTSNVTDMFGMFARSQVTTLDLSNFDTQKVTLMNGMFAGSQVTSLDLSSFDTSNVTDMSNMFVDSQVTSLDLSSFDTSNVTAMFGMFAGSQVTTLDLSNFDTSKVTNMSGMFSDSRVTNIDVSNFNTSNVTDMSYMFAGSQTTIINISNFDTSKVNYFDSMFEEAKNLEELDVNKIDMTSAISWLNMFLGCNKLPVVFKYSNSYLSTQLGTSAIPVISLSNGSTDYIVKGYQILKGENSINFDSNTGVASAKSAGQVAVKVEVELSDGTTKYAIGTITIISKKISSSLTDKGSTTITVSTSNYDYYSSNYKPNYSKLVAFIPKTSGTYTFKSSSSIDTYGRLYNSNMSSLTYNDDSGGNRQFSMTYNCIAGQIYYVAVGLYSSSSSSSTITLIIE